MHFLCKIIVPTGKSRGKKRSKLFIGANRNAISTGFESSRIPFDVPAAGATNKGLAPLDRKWLQLGRCLWDYPGLDGAGAGVGHHLCHLPFACLSTLICCCTNTRSEEEIELLLGQHNQCRNRQGHPLPSAEHLSRKSK